MIHAGISGVVIECAWSAWDEFALVLGSAQIGSSACASIRPVGNRHLDSLRVSTAPTTLTVRPPGGVTQRLTNVVIVALDDSTATIEMPDGERRSIPRATLVGTEPEHKRRRLRERVELILDALSLTR